MFACKLWHRSPREGQTARGLTLQSCWPILACRRASSVYQMKPLSLIAHNQVTLVLDSAAAFMMERVDLVCPLRAAAHATCFLRSACRFLSVQKLLLKVVA
jgi:hypothetical protein